ncbi:MAG: GntR family transcriptional regulator [Gemmatimonadaceae bacterium]|nr:GntR family transcriptional regulator [Gemmatimonadaceae bacterium]
MRGAIAARPRREFVAEAYERLRDLIVQGKLGPGARLIETELSERLEMSRTPLRTALYLLAQEGYLESSSEGRQSRLSVVAPTRDDAAEVFSIVGEVEALSAQRAATLAKTKRSALAAELRLLNAAMRVTATRKTPNPADTIRADGDFHRAFVTAGAGRRLLSFFRSAKPHADRCIYLYYAALTDDIIASTQEHEAIIDAIASGDAQAARRAVKANWRHAAQRLAKSMTAFGERGVW